MATQITFSIISESRLWYARPEFFPTPYSGPCADLVGVCADILLKHDVLGRVLGAELHDLYR
jgi:hypothetical protein